LRCLII